MFGWEFPPFNSGGLGTACLGLTRALARLGVDVLFVLPKKLALDVDHCKILFADPSLTLLSFNSLLVPYISAEEYVQLRGKGAGRWSHSLQEEVVRYALLSRDIARNEHFDVIHAHDWLSFMAGIEAKRVSGKPLVVHVHATEFDRVGPGPISQFVYEVERRGMDEADWVIAVSEFTKRIIVDRYRVPERKIQVVHNGVDESDYLKETATPEVVKRLKDEGNSIVLFVGRITLQKGPDYFVRVAERILEFEPNVYFVIAGSGDMEGKIIEEVARLRLTDRFIFTGFLRGDDLHKVYRAADVYIMPSVSEPFGIAPLEAITHGVPTLISREAGVAEVLTHTLRVDFWDIDEMANKVVALLRHPELRKTLCLHAREELKRINWNEAAKKCVMLYNEL